MDMTGERRIPAPRQQVWDALNDPEVLKACIPGCEKLERTGDEMTATAAVRIGPISARSMAGGTRRTSIRRRATASAARARRGRGLRQGRRRRAAEEIGAGTLLKYDVKAQVGGKIAQLGARLIDSTSKQMADKFFDRFSAAVAAPEPVAAPVIAAAPLATALAHQPAEAAAFAPTQASHPAAPGGDGAQAGLLDLIPREPFGFPRIAVAGTVIWLAIFSCCSEAMCLAVTAPASVAATAALLERAATSRTARWPPRSTSRCRCTGHCSLKANRARARPRSPRCSPPGWAAGSCGCNVMTAWIWPLPPMSGTTPSS